MLNFRWGATILFLVWFGFVFFNLVNSLKPMCVEHRSSNYQAISLFFLCTFLCTRKVGNKKFNSGIWFNNLKTCRLAHPGGPLMMNKAAALKKKRKRKRFLFKMFALELIARPFLWWILVISCYSRIEYRYVFISCHNFAFLIGIEMLILGLCLYWSCCG